MGGFWKDITTGKDNETADVIRVAMVAIICSLIATLVLGVVTYIYGYFYSLAHPDTKLFDIQTFFTATSTYAVGVGAFIMGGAASLYMKKTTEPDGTTTDETSITHGSEGPAVQINNVTTKNETRL